MSLIVLGLDPGFSALGYALVNLYTKKLVSLGVVRTKKSDKKRRVLASDDNLRRSREIHRELMNLLGEHDDDRLMGCGHYDGTNCVAVCAEAMSFPRNSSAAAKVAMSWGIIASVADRFGLPVVQASPQEIKKKLCGRKDASKEDIEAAVKKLYRADDSWLKNVPDSLHEHAWDALSAIAGCADSDVLLMAKQLRGRTAV